MNFFGGVVDDGAVRVTGLGDATLPTSVALPGDGAEVMVGLRPNHLTIVPDGDSHAVDLTESLGGVSYVYLNAPQRRPADRRGARGPAGSQRIAGRGQL